MPAMARNNHEGTAGEDLEQVCRMQFEDKFKGVFAANFITRSALDRGRGSGRTTGVL